jgi:hypothetical protein
MNDPILTAIERGGVTEIHVYHHYDPPKPTLCVGFSSSAKGEAQPELKVTGSDEEDVSRLLSVGIRKVSDYGRLFKQTVDGINGRTNGLT